MPILLANTRYSNAVTSLWPFGGWMQGIGAARRKHLTRREHVGERVENTTGLLYIIMYQMQRSPCT
jgi:hypothetical protein